MLFSFFHVVLSMPWASSLHQFLKNYLIVERETRSDTEKKRSIFWFTPQAPAIETKSGSFMWAAGSWLLDPSAQLPRVYTGRKLKSENLGQDLNLSTLMENMNSLTSRLDIHYPLQVESYEHTFRLVCLWKKKKKLQATYGSKLIKNVV